MLLTGYEKGDGFLGCERIFRGSSGVKCDGDRTYGVFCFGYGLAVLGSRTYG